MPTILSGNNSAEASRMLVEAIMNPVPASPFNTMGSEQMRALHQFPDLFAVSIPANEVTAPIKDPIRLTQLPPTPTLAPRVLI